MTDHEEFALYTTMYLDGALDDKSLAQLRGMLQESEEYRDEFVAICSQTAELREHHAATPVVVDGIAPRQSEHANRTGTSARVFAYARRVGEAMTRPLALSLSVAAVTVTAVLGLLAWQDAPATNATFAARGESRESLFVARLAAAKDCRWEKDAIAFQVGSLLKQGETLAIAAGLAEVIFDDGARMLIEGPARVEIATAGSVRLSAGRVMGYVPQRAIGFAVITPQCDVVDLGTEFGVVVDGERVDEGQATEVHVVQGAVRVEIPAAENRRVVRAGEAARVAAPASGGVAAEIAAIPPRAEQFVRSDSNAENASEKGQWITADFDDQHDSRSGWKTPWNTFGSGRVQRSDDHPLGSDGNGYLQASFNSEESCLRRTYGKHGEVDPAQPHVIRWKWRYDGNMAELSNFHDRVHFFADSNAIQGSTHTNAWLIGVAFGVEGDRRPIVGRWYFYNSQQSGMYNGDFHQRNMVDTQIKLQAGVVYEFEVIVDPQQGTYSATIFDGREKFTATDLHFRNGKPGAHSVLHFGTCARPAGEDHTFSLDAIEIRAVESQVSPKRQ